MAELSHDPPGTAESSDQSSAKTATPDLISISMNGSDGSSNITGLISVSSMDRDQTMDSSCGLKQEEHSGSLIDGVPGNMDGSDQPHSETAQVDVFPHLQKATASEEVEALSCYQSTGARILQEIAQILSSNLEEVDNARLSFINTLKERAKTPRTVLGVVGGTGHGKSSLINVLLEEDHLVPTNCFRACTAVVTEISWNTSDDPDHRYIAEIEFISAEDWHRELGYLLHDLVSSTGETPSDLNIEESDAGIAWAKIKAVFPTMSRQAIGQADLKALANDPAVKTLLGTTRTVNKRTAGELYEAIQIYVDSKKKTGFAPTGEIDNKARKMELWPLIKVVRIYTKSDILATGAVIVDLPGVKDSNAARAAVAGKYIERCDGLWVVSMIHRAVDDKAAQELLGERFKQQLQLDGNYSNVTFVCSKTDDINIREAADGLGLGGHAQRLKNAKHSLSKLTASSELENLRKRKDAISTYAEEVDRHIDRYDKLRRTQAKGKTVTPPKEHPGKKRKARASIATSNKRRKVNSDLESQDTQWISTEDRWGDLERNMPKYPAERILTSEDIESMTEYLRSQKASSNEEKEGLVAKINDEEDRIESLDEEVLELEEQLSIACVSRRNDYSRRAIRDQFALGLKEIDEHEAQRVDPNRFDPERKLRDYAEVGRALPVFCVSSRAYQALSTDEERMKGFGKKEDTEIPQLQAHTIQLTVATRMRGTKSFLNDLAQTLNSLYLWSSKKDTEIYLTDEEKKTEMGYVRDQIEELDKRLQTASEDASRQVNEILEALFVRIKAASLQAAKCAPDIARGWPSKKRGDGGLPCMTYKATLRRDGVFSGGSGPRNFNEDLVTPLLKQLGSHWETAFTKKIPNALNAHAKTCQKHQEYIQGLIQSRLRERVTFNGIIGMLQDQDKKRVIGLANKINSLNSDVTTLQREANREFAPAIQRMLNPKYREQSMDSGPGVFARIKLGIESEITKRAKAIFKASTESPQAKLSNLPGNIQEELQAYITIMRDEMISDYSNVILGADSSGQSKVIRQKIYELLKEVDGRFAGED
ncbi:hypothetical protein F5Y07DRAFT_395830 [Xylaria sp. FL0933]|nr:hypothetical protein F5Y07DRAFT_395830 [Xylaria sp. FL0933]